MDDSDSCDEHCDCDNKYKLVKGMAYPVWGVAVSFCAFFIYRVTAIMLIVALLFSGVVVQKYNIDERATIKHSAVGQCCSKSGCDLALPVPRIITICVVYEFVIIIGTVFKRRFRFFGYPVGANAPPSIICV